MTNPAVPPELASILATLAQFAPQQQPEQQSPQPPTITAPTTADPRLLRRQQAQSSHPPFPQTSSNQSNPYTPQAANFNPVQSQQRSTPQPTEQTIIDPATITEWSAGLRCVTKIAAQNPLFGDKIRGLINDQRRNEMQWYSSRQALKQMQAKRSASANELANILKSVGGTPFTSTTADQQPTQTPEEKAAELAAFDQKLYKAQLAMNDSMSAVLKGLGVPFFGTHAGLILPDGVESKVGNMLGGQDVQGDRPKWSPRVTADELLELKRRMIGYLEDMYKQ